MRIGTPRGRCGAAELACTPDRGRARNSSAAAAPRRLAVGDVADRAHRFAAALADGHDDGAGGDGILDCLKLKNFHKSIPKFKPMPPIDIKH
ncbi:MAG TPA: hypothetical protein VLK58_21195, partial [Conexibacter sp.]|nr:hypothetical protein [Conexibacter sp.]